MDDSKYTFSRSERNGAIFLISLILLSIFFKNYITHLFLKEHSVNDVDKAKIASLQQQINEAKESYSYNSSLDDKSFNSKTKEYYKSNSSSTEKEHEKFVPFSLEVNSATAEDYEKLYGIGKVLSQRIVTFRDKLEGFYSINQVKDVFGVEDSVFQKFKSHLTIKPVQPKKININTATYEELTANPYFFSTVAKQIIGYRTKVKPFATTEDVKVLYFIKDHPEHFDKMKPYIQL